MAALVMSPVCFDLVLQTSVRVFVTGTTFGMVIDARGARYSAVRDDKRRELAR
jgi:hypothetical protein